MAAFVANGLFLFLEVLWGHGGMISLWLADRKRLLRHGYTALTEALYCQNVALKHILCYNADIWQHSSTVRNILDSFQCIPSTFFFFKKNIYEMFKHLLFFKYLYRYYYVGKKVTRLMLTLTMHHGTCLAWSFSPFFLNLPLFAHYIASSSPGMCVRGIHLLCMYVCLDSRLNPFSYCTVHCPHIMPDKCPSFVFILFLYTSTIYVGVCSFYTFP